MTKKNINMRKELGKLTPEQSKELAAQFNGGMGMGISPKKSGNNTSKKKK